MTKLVYELITECHERTHDIEVLVLFLGTLPTLSGWNSCNILKNISLLITLLWLIFTAEEKSSLFSSN